MLQRLPGPAFAWSAFLAVGMGLPGCQMSVATVVQQKVKGKPVNEVVDVDGDGVTVFGGDCDDADATIFPGAIEVCDGIDNDCSESVDDAGACTTYRSMSQTALADVLVVVDTHESMEDFLLDFGLYASELGLPFASPAADVNVGVASMEPTGDLFAFANRNHVSAGGYDGATAVTEWVRKAVAELPTTPNRGRGRDAVVALLLDSAVVGVEPRSPQPQSSTLADTGYAPDGAAEALLDTGADTGAGAEGGPDSKVDELILGGEEGPLPGGSFRRDRAPLTVVFLSRSEDGSTTGVKTFEHALDLTVDPEQRTVHAVVGFGGPCQEASVDDGATYRDLALSTGGLAVDICRMGPDDLSAIGEAIAEEGLNQVHRLPGDFDAERGYRLQASLPDGSVIDFAPDAYEVDVEAWQLIVDDPPPAGSIFTFTYERVP